jgi:diphthamide biosynthesis protein 2
MYSVGTLAAAQHGTVLKHLRQIVRNAGVACYTVVVGKLNEPKLANIANVGVYCLVACREVIVVCQL